MSIYLRTLNVSFFGGIIFVYSKSVKLSSSHVQQKPKIMAKYSIFLLLFHLLMLTLLDASIDRVKNFKIDKPELVKRSENDMKAEMNLPSKSSFPHEMTASFEAFGKFFTLKLRRNDDLMSSDLKIITIGQEEEADESDNSNGAAYNGDSLEIKDKENSSSSTASLLKDPFARFFATLKDDGSIQLQGAFEWNRNFFKITNENHPNVKYHVSPDQISLLKRSSSTSSEHDNSAAMSKRAQSNDLVILKDSMDVKRNSGAFGFSFNSGSNSTVPFRCGHDDLNFNVDPRGVGNDFVTKLTRRDLDHDHSHDHTDEHAHETSIKSKINPLTAQYYLSKRAAAAIGSDSMNPSENGCPVNRKTLYLGIAVDSAYLAKFDGDRQAAVSNILSDFNLVSAIYEKTFNIELGIVTITIVGKSEGKKTNGKVPWDLPCNSNFDINNRLSAFSEWRDSQSKDLGKK